MCIPIIGVGDTTKPLLSCCVPDLKLNSGVVHIHYFVLKIQFDEYEQKEIRHLKVLALGQLMAVVVMRQLLT